MIESIKATLTNWNTSTTERRKLQHTYLAITIVTILIAGLISLINPSLGHTVVLFGIFAVCAFIANGVIWTLLNALVLAKLPGKSKRK